MHRRHGTAGGWIGFAMVTGGAAGVAWDSIENFNPTRISMLLVVVGAVIAGYAKLKVRTEANSEAYHLGYDIGFENGHQKGHSSPRPVVVDMAARRCTCGSKKADRTAEKVGERV